MPDLQHASIPDVYRHEPKGISTATAGQVYVSDGAGGGSWIDTNLLDISTGWADYRDGQYHSGAKRTLSAGVRTKLTIDGVSITDESQLPPDAAASLWNVTTNKIIPISLGDGYEFRLGGQVQPLAGATPSLFIELDVGGAAGTIIARTVPLIKGTAADSLTFAFPMYIGADFSTNGGEIYLTASDDTNVWDMGVFILRTHKGR